MNKNNKVINIDKSHASNKEAREKNIKLEIVNINKSYKGKKVVNDFSLNVNQGEIVGLLGPNGAGKSTSFYIITGLIHADYGKIIFDDIDITNYNIHERGKLGISYLPQEMSIFRDMTTFENVMSIAEITYENKFKANEIVEELFEEFQIGHLRDIKGISLSGGERRRVEIARCLASNPLFVLFDEPFAGVDPLSIGTIHELIFKLKNRNIGVIITDHNVRETLEIIDRAYIIFDGKVLIEGDAKTITNDEKVKKFYLGDKFKI